MLAMNQKTTPQKHDFAGLADWFPIFLTGDHVASNGRKLSVTEDDLDSIVANYNAEQPAPLVVGHVKDNTPAYGWTDGLKREGGTLFAKAADVVSEFELAVQKKMYRNRSVSIIPEGDGFKLNHIAFLGGKPPAVAGIGDVAFSAASEADTFEFTMTDEQRWGTSRGLSSVGRVLRRFRDWMIDEKDLETADQIIPDYDIESIESAAADVRNSDRSTSHFSQKPNAEDITVDPKNKKEFSQSEVDTAVAAALATEQEKTDKREGDLKYQADLTEANTLVSGMVATGQLLPAQTPGLAEFMASLPSADDSTFEFAAAEEGADPLKKTPAEFMAEFMGGMGKQIELGADGTQAPGDGAEHNYQAPDGFSVDPDRAKLHEQALDYQAEHKCEYIVAVKAVEKGE